MHFHWDNFDTFARRALRVFAPPIVNFLILLIVFSDTVSRSLNWVWVKVSATFSQSLSASDVAAEGAKERAWDALATMLETIAKELSTIEIAWPSLNVIIERTLSAMGTAAYVTAITTLLSLIFLAFLLDWSLRGFALLLPLRLRIKERNLVHHSRFDIGFKNAQRLLNVDTRGRDTKGRFLAGGNRDLCKYEIWTRVQAILDNREGKAALYRHARAGILLSIDENRKWFSYAVGYGALFSFVAASDNFAFPTFFSEAYQFFGALFIVAFGVHAIVRHIQLSVELVDLDIETFLATGDPMNQNHEIADAKTNDHENWMTVIGFLGWTNRDPKSMFFNKE